MGAACTKSSSTCIASLTWRRCASNWRPTCTGVSSEGTAEIPSDFRDAKPRGPIAAPDAELETAAGGQPRLSREAGPTGRRRGRGAGCPGLPRNAHEERRIWRHRLGTERLRGSIITMTDERTLVVLGVGAMSVPMIENARASGIPLRIWNRTVARAEALGGSGVQVFERAEDAVEPGALVFSCFSADDALDEVFGDGRVFKRMGRGSVHLSMTTCRPDTQRRLADALAQVGGAHVSAPLLGRPDLVRARKHSVLLSGVGEAKARAEPALAALSARRFDFGAAPEAAAVVKLCTNHLIAAAIQTMAESIALAEKNGVDPGAMHAMWTETIFGSVVHQGYGRSIVDRSYTEPLFRLDLGLKDVRLVKALGEASGAEVPTAELLERELRAAVDAGLARYDWTGVADRSFARAGLPTATPTTD